MIHRDAKQSRIEWLVSCAPEGDRCYDPQKNEHCRNVWYNVTLYSGFGISRWYDQYCSTYGFRIVDGKKCEMCIQVAQLEALKHLNPQK